MVQADKKPPENKPKVEYIVDFSSGLNTTISPALLNKNEAQLAEDVSFEQKGTIVPRRGRRKRYETPFSTSPVTGIAGYFKSDGTSRLVVATGDKVYADEPHMEYKWTTQADWEQEGTSRGVHVDTASVSGSLRIKRGDKNGISSDNPNSSTVTGGYTYGWKFKPNTDLALFKIRFRVAKKDLLVRMTLWDAATKQALISTISVAPSVNPGSWYVHELPATVELAKDKEYVIGVYSPDKDFLYMWTSGQSVTFSSDITRVGAYKTAQTSTDLVFPETSTTDVAYAIDIVYDIVETSFTRTIDSGDDFNAGTKTQVTVDTAAGSVALAVEAPAQEVTDSSPEDFDGGIKDNVSTTEISGSVVLARMP